MAEVYPITNFEDVKAIRRVLTKWGHVKFAEAFFIGCHIGLRACDFLGLRFDQIEGKGKKIYVTEKKTGKLNDILITPRILESVEILKKYYQEKHPYVEHVYLFQTTSNSCKGDTRHITVDAFRKLLKQACEAIGLDDNFGSHTCRKTTGYHLYKQTGDIHLVQKRFNHKSAHETLAYIGVQRKQLDAAMLALDFG